MKQKFSIVMAFFMLTVLYQNCGDMSSVKQQSQSLSNDQINNDGNNNTGTPIHPCDSQYDFADNLLLTLVDMSCISIQDANHIDADLQGAHQTCFDKEDPSVFEKIILKLEEKIDVCEESEKPSSEYSSD